MPESELIIARHGEAHCNRDGIIGGTAGCSGLTNTGQQQAQRLAQRLRYWHQQRPFAALYTTPLRRAHQTATIVGSSIDMQPQVVDDLAEQHHGDADGQPWNDIVTAFGDIPANQPDTPLASGGETWREYLDRSTQALQRILANHGEQRVIIVGHGETIDAAFHYFMRLPAISRSTIAIASHHTSLTTWAQLPVSWTKPEAGLRWALTSHNDAVHLD